MFSYHQFNQDIFNNNTPQYNNTVSSLDKKQGDNTRIASLNNNTNNNNRKNSIFDHSHFNITMTSPTTNTSDLFNGAANANANASKSKNNENDPFELNTSIWNNNPNPQQLQQLQQQQQQPLQVHHQQPSFQSTHHSVSAASGNNNGAGAGAANAFQRRASYNDYYPNNGNANNNTRFNSNYTIWSNNNMIDDYTTNMMWQQQQQQQHAQVAQAQHQHQQQAQAAQAKYQGDSGFLLSPRRHSYTPSSLDSPSFSPSYEHQLNIPEEMMGLNPSTITESSPSFIQAYQSVDYYFTQDQYNRVTIKDYSVSEMTSMLENLVQKGAQLPRFSGNSLPSTQLVLIAFKAGRVDVFYLPDTSPLRLKLNDLVVVEADRGRDLGKIVKLDVSIDEARLLKYLQHQEQQAALASFDNPGSVSSNPGSSPPPLTGSSSTTQTTTQGSNGQGSSSIPTLHFPKPIVRLALPTEILQITNKLNDEEKAKKICSLKVESSLLSMCVIDAEYQWDRRKLTFYYNAVHRIDFRDLVRELFRIYKTRIWMCAVGSDVKDTSASTECVNINIGSNVGAGNDLSDIWETPSNGTNGANNGLKKDDPNMFIPRQFSSPDQSIWK